MMPFATISSDPELGAVANITRHFEPISLPELIEMDGAVLLDRVDIKYLLQPWQVLTILAAIHPYYRVLEVDSVRLQRYQTLYFDTEDFAFYLQHHNDARSRYKVRFRTYVDSNLTFLEVKLKNNKERTVKSRIRVDEVTPVFGANMQTFLCSCQPFDPQSLAPRISNSFLRITLVSKAVEERLTLDLKVQFDDDNAATLFPAIAIAEVKQSHYSRLSPFVQQVRKLAGREIGITKYCIGAALRYPYLKANNFKTAFLQMDKLGNRYKRDTNQL